ncbi:hypothetical protein, partial [Stenotrophomonas maltophilia]
MIEATAFRKVLASSTAFAAMAIALPAWAQTTTPEAPQASAQAAPAEEGEILVTGTRIRRDGFQAPTPLTVLTQQDIQNT